MPREEARDYHVRRARAELDLAYRTEDSSAMIAHLRLSALHMARMRALAAATTACAPGPRAYSA